MKNINNQRTLEEGDQNGIRHRGDSVKETEVPLTGNYEQGLGSYFNVFHGCHLKKKLFGEALEGEVRLRGKKAQVK